jgi:hypothetical protein
LPRPNLSPELVSGGSTVKEASPVHVIGTGHSTGVVISPFFIYFIIVPPLPPLQMHSPGDKREMILMLKGNSNEN